VVPTADGTVVLTSDLCLSQSQSGRVQAGGGGDPRGGGAEKPQHGREQQQLALANQTAFKTPEQINQALFRSPPVPPATVSAPRPELSRLLFCSGDSQRAREALAVKWSARRVRLAFAAWRSGLFLARRRTKALAHSARKRALQTQARCLHAWDFSRRRQRGVCNHL